MKSINELYQEVKGDEELRNKFLAVYGKGEIEGFLKDNECDATAEEALRLIEQEIRSGSYELSDEELALVVGGGLKDNDTPAKYREGTKVSFEDVNDMFHQFVFEGIIQSVSKEDCLSGSPYLYGIKITYDPSHTYKPGVVVNINEDDILGVILN